MAHDASDDRTRRSRRVAIIGAGPGGICTAVSLLARGHDDFVILEQAPGHRRHLVPQPLPGRRVRHQVAPLLLLVRAQPRVVAAVRAPARDQGLPGRRRRPLRPAPPHPAEHAGPLAALGRRPRGVARHRGRRRGARRRRRGQRDRDVRRARRPRRPRPRPVPGDDVPLRAMGRRPRPHRRTGRGDRQRGRARCSSSPRSRRWSARSPCTSAPRTGCSPKDDDPYTEEELATFAADPDAVRAVARRDLHHHRPQPHVRRRRTPGAGRAVRRAQHRRGRGSGAARPAHARHAVRMQAAAGVERLLPHVQPAARRARHRRRSPRSPSTAS